MKYIFSLLAASILLSSCEVSVKTKDAPAAGGGSSKIKNGIEFTAKGLTVEQAFLLYEDGTLVPPENTAAVNQKVILRMIVSGWKEKDGKVFLSGGEKVETNEGGVVLDEPNLFGAYKDGLSPEDAKFISINVVITKVDRLYDYYKVNFFLKDESEGGGLVEGYYKLYIK